MSELTVRDLIANSFELAKEKGWWPDTVLFNVPEKLALIHSEVSEALEEFRRDGRVLTRCGHCNGTGKCEECRERLPEESPDGRCLDCGGAAFFSYVIDRDSGKPEGFVIELADVVIRVADLCGALGLDLQRAIEIKHAYNRTREFRHGGKSC